MNFNDHLQRKIIPGLKNSIIFYERTLRQYLDQSHVWLDVGCGHQILPSWLPNAPEKEDALLINCKQIFGVDYDLSSLKQHKKIRNKTVADVRKIPFKNNSFDLVTANMVVEHFDNPKTVFQEISRVLKKGGRFIIHTPNTRSYLILISKLVPKFFKKKLIGSIDGRKETDIFPTYYRVNNTKEIIRLAKISGFRVESIKLLCTSAQFRSLPFLFIFELIWIRLLMLKKFNNLRTNLIAVLKKQY